MRRKLYACAIAWTMCTSGSAGAASAPVASVRSEAAFSNIEVQAQFLVRAGDLAKMRAANETIKRFAEAERAKQAAVLDELGRQAPGQLTADLGPQGVATGRSVAEGPLESKPRVPPGEVDTLLSAAVVALDHLSSAQGGAFDDLYMSLARSVLANLAGDYEAYAQTGDEPLLRAVAARALPRVRADEAVLAASR